MSESAEVVRAQRAGPQDDNAFHGSMAIEPLGPTISAPPSGSALAALNFMGRLFFGLIRRGLLGGRRSKMKSSPTRKIRCGAMGLTRGFFLLGGVGASSAFRWAM